MRHPLFLLQYFFKDVVIKLHVYHAHDLEYTKDIDVNIRYTGDEFASFQLTNNLPECNVVPFEEVDLKIHVPVYCVFSYFLVRHVRYFEYSLQQAKDDFDLIYTLMGKEYSDEDWDVHLAKMLKRHEKGVKRAADEPLGGTKKKQKIS